MSPNCSFLEFLAYILEKSSKFGIFSSQNETEIMFFWGPIGIFGLISSVWDVFNRIQSYLEPGNLKSSFFGNFKFEANFAHFLASKNDYSHKSAIFSWKKPKWSKKDENMYKVYRKYKKTVSKTLWKWRKCARFEALCPPSPCLWNFPLFWRIASLIWLWHIWQLTDNKQIQILDFQEGFELNQVLLYSPKSVKG